MSDAFDPYHVWLGIPPDEQPPNRYRLLGIRLFESNSGVIDNAADRQMSHLRSVQAGDNAKLSQRLLNEVSAARVCLLNPQAKATYDLQLRKEPPVAVPPPPPLEFNSLTERPPAPPSPGRSSIRENAAPGLPTGVSHARINRPLYVAIGACLLLAVAIGIAVFGTSGPSNAVLIFDWPAAERAGATLTIDGQPVEIPAAGPWEYRLPPGEHRIIAHRPKLKFESTIAVAAGNQPSIAAVWKPKALLALNWPRAERNDAKLLIDARPQPVSRDEPLEFPMEPGRHVVQVTRPESEPFEATLIITNDQRESVNVTTPRWPALVLNLPAEQRQDATLTIDGKPVAIDSSAARLSYRFKPGQHTVHITRPGFQPFVQIADLSAGNSTLMTPIWQPVAAKPDPASAKLVAVNEPIGADKAASDASSNDTGPLAKKQSPPGAAEQERIAKDVDGIYKVSHSAVEDRALVAKLFKTADEPGSSAAERFVLLSKGIALAGTLGDFDTAFQGIDALEMSYEIDAFAKKQKLLDESVKTLTTADQVTGLVGAAIPLVDRAIAADRFDAALSVVATVKKGIAKRSADSRRFKEAEEQLAVRQREISDLQSLWITVQDAQRTLGNEPDNAAANLTVGRWYCLTKNDWPKGLPYLVKGSDENLQSLAKQELAGQLDAKQRVQVADGWWGWAEMQKGVVSNCARLHAGELYQAALPSLDSPLKKAVIEKRLAEVAAIQPPGRQPAVNANVVFTRGQWVDLLRVVNPTADAVNGRWSRKGTGIACEPSDFCRIRFPVELTGGYDFEVEFTRSDGNDEINAIIPVGGETCLVMLSAKGGKESGLSRVDGVSVRDQQTYAVRPGKLENGRRYRLLVSVRVLKDNMATIDVSLDDKPLWRQWNGPVTALLPFAGWQMPTPKQIGLGAWHDRVTFSSVRLRVASGEATSAPKDAKMPKTVTIISARFGAGNNWADVTQFARAIIRNGEPVWARLDSLQLQSDPSPGRKKHLELTLDNSGKREKVSIDEGNVYQIDEKLSR